MTLPSTAARPPAIVLGSSVNAVSAVRSLASAGVEVTVYAETVRHAPARHSRFTTGFRRPGPGDVQAQWLAWLEGAPASVLVACCDDGVELLARHRAVLEGWGHRVPEADDGVLLAMLDKTRTYELAAAAGVATPTTMAVRGESDIEEAAELLGFPCALKPRASHVWARTRSGKALVVHDRGQLAREGRALLAEGLAMLVTEIVPGPDANLCSYYTWIDGAGDPLLHFTKRKLRQLPIGFGTGTYHVTAWDERVAKEGLRFFQGVGLRGFGNVEFKRDERDGRLVLIECNPRLTAAAELVRRAGIDLARFTYCRAAGLPTPAVSAFRDGVYQWLPGRDLAALLAYRRAGLLGVGEWLRSLAHPQTFAVFAWDDPMPALAGAARRLPQAVGRVTRSRRG